MKGLLFILVLIATLAVGCGQGSLQVQVPIEVKTAPTPTPTCNTKSVTDFLSASSKSLTEFRDAFELANQTPRSVLAAQIQSLQKIHRDYDAIDAPDCAQRYKQLVSDAMENYINGFLNFLVKVLVLQRMVTLKLAIII